MNDEPLLPPTRGPIPATPPQFSADVAPGSRALQLLEEAFAGTRTPRSWAYRRGVLHVLLAQVDRIEPDPHGYLPGSAEFDAWAAGCDEGWQIVRGEHLTGGAR